MKTILRLAPILVLAVAPAARAGDKPAGDDHMAGWKPPAVKNADRDRKEINALHKRMEEAGMKGDLEAATAFIDFPVLMVTDDSKGEAGGDSWSREKWVEVMKPMYKPMKPGSMESGKLEIMLLSDSLALVSGSWKVKMEGGKSMSGSSGWLLVRKGGQWKVKALVEGGWGDMPMPGQSASAPATGAATAAK